MGSALATKVQASGDLLALGIAFAAFHHIVTIRGEPSL
jgi:hypothetical protein